MWLRRGVFVQNVPKTLGFWEYFSGRSRGGEPPPLSAPVFKLPMKMKYFGLEYLRKIR